MRINVEDELVRWGLYLIRIGEIPHETKSGHIEELKSMNINLSGGSLKLTLPEHGAARLTAYERENSRCAGVDAALHKYAEQQAYWLARIKYTNYKPCGKPIGVDTIKKLAHTVMTRKGIERNLANAYDVVAQHFGQKTMAA